MLLYYYSVHKLINERLCYLLAYKKREELLKYIEVIENHIRSLEQENEELKQRIIDLENGNSVQKIKNERNAGRKRKFTKEEVAIIDMLHLQGKSIRAIAKEMNCSVGLVHKLLNEPIGDRNK